MTRFVHKWMHFWLELTMRKIFKIEIKTIFYYFSLLLFNIWESELSFCSCNEMQSTNYSWISQNARVAKYRNQMTHIIIWKTLWIPPMLFGTWYWRAIFWCIQWCIQWPLFFLNLCVLLQMMRTFGHAQINEHMFSSLPFPYASNGCNVNVMFINNGFCFILNHFNCHNGLGIFQFACDDALNTLWLMMSQMINCRPSHLWFVQRGKSIETHKTILEWEWLWSIVVEISLNRVYWQQQSNKQITKRNKIQQNKTKRQNVSIHSYIIFWLDESINSSRKLNNAFTLCVCVCRAKRVWVPVWARWVLFLFLAYSITAADKLQKELNETRELRLFVEFSAFRICAHLFDEMKFPLNESRIRECRMQSK